MDGLRVVALIVWPHWQGKWTETDSERLRVATWCFGAWFYAPEQNGRSNR